MQYLPELRPANIPRNEKKALGFSHIRSSRPLLTCATSVRSQGMPHFFVGVAELQDDDGPSVRPLVESDLRVWCRASQHTYVSLLRSEKQTEWDQLLSDCRVGECCTLPDRMWLFELLILGLNGLLHLHMEDWPLALLVTGELLDGSVDGAVRHPMKASLCVLTNQG